MLIELKGKIDSGNIKTVESEIFGKLDGVPSGEKVVLDCSGLEYVSSAGLRMVLRIRKMYPATALTNVSGSVYEVLEMTGFTEMMSVEKAYREISIEGCEEIGRGANGTIYRIDSDNVVKVYRDADALEDIKHEREVAKLALILGLPTAISYDVVKIGDTYGSVFELLNARSFANILAAEPEKFDWCVDEYVKLLKKIHGTVVPAGKLPDMRQKALGWVNDIKNELPCEAWNKLYGMVEAIPHDDHMIHGDYHTKNVELQGDEVLIIDMDTLAVGHPVFELAGMYNSFRGFSEYDSSTIERFQGFDLETGTKFWQRSLAEYLGTDSPTKIKEVEDKARVLGYVRLVRRAMRRGLSDPVMKSEYELWKEHLLELLETTDSLVFSPNELEIYADVDNLHEVQDFVDEHLPEDSCPLKTKMQIRMAVEEIFVNIASYAYQPGRGKATVRVEVDREPVTVSITFVDHGIPYDPLAKEDPDVTLKAEDRSIGGLGIFMTKQFMDDIEYEYKDGNNILTLKKNLRD